jgi:tetratricopeptide (TPR) repeat protein
VRRPSTTVIRYIAWMPAMALAALSAAGCGKQANETPSLPAVGAENQSFSFNDGYAFLARGDVDQAEKVAVRLLTVAPESPEALLLGAAVSQQKGELDQAISMLDLVPDEPEVSAMKARAKAAMLEFDRMAVWEGIRRMEAIRKRWPEQLEPAAQLSSAYSAMGLGWDARACQFALVKAGRPDEDVLMTLADRTWPAVDPSYVDAALEAYPADLRPQIAQANMQAAEAKWQEALDKAVAILAKNPEFLPAYLVQGRALHELGRLSELEAWGGTATPAAKQHPDYWLVSGLAARQLGQLEPAARAFWEAARLDPDSQIAHNELAQVLDELERPADSKQFWERAQGLVDLRELLHLSVGWRGGSQRVATRIAERLSELGRVWEAVAWADLAKRLPADPVARDNAKIRGWRERMAASASRVEPSKQPALAIDLSQYPEPIWSAEGASATSAPAAETAASLPLRFSNSAASTGLQFLYETGDDPKVPGMWIWQTNGGGAAAIDFDLDGWTDLYLSQAGGQPFQADGSQPNRLFWNRRGRQWTDATDQSRTGDRGYAQGVTSGDLDSDGFADLIVANIGRLTLLHNNGDGTFTDRTAESGVGSESGWATSVAIADLDDDGHADIYVANYCGGQEPFTVPCSSRHDPSQYRACTPTAFTAAPDVVYRGRGDGTFENVSDRWLDPAADGRGLGLIVANLDDRPGLELFVANDMTANLFWVAQESESGRRFTDAAGVRGLAFDHRGRSQACMGVACADPDHDGDLDLVVTNFYDEANNYYVQQRPGRFVDRAQTWGLAEPSLKVLGFGTQWADFDNDGSLDLLVSNGHIDDFTYRNVPYAMPAQLFTSHDGPLELLDTSDSGEYFASPHLGRSLATLDWNRDGLSDAVIVHLLEPAALLTNQTDARYHWVGFELVSTSGQRDAIGAAVTVRHRGRQSYQQVVAGNGYQCSNEKVIRFGLGDQTEVEELVVTWPTGVVESFGPITADRQYLLVEGTGFAVPRSEPSLEAVGSE